MKKLLILSALFMMSVVMFGQTKGTVTTLTVDTIDSVTAVNFPLVVEFENNQTIAIQAVCANVSGTSEGSLYLQGSLDGTSYQTLSTTAGFLVGVTNDTLTISDGAIGLWYLVSSPFNYYRLQGTGGAGDSTEVTVKWVRKDN